MCLFGWFLNVLVNYWVISRTGPKTERLTILRAAPHETELGDHDFCLSRSHYTDTDPTSKEGVATAGMEPVTSSPGVARSIDWATVPLKKQRRMSRRKRRRRRRRRKTRTRTRTRRTRRTRTRRRKKEVEEEVEGGGSEEEGKG